MQVYLLQHSTGMTPSIVPPIFQKVMQNTWTFGQTSFPSPARYLPLINNARDAKSASIKEGITRLRLFVMIMWRNDTMVTPRESSHFQFYRSGQVFLSLFLAVSSDP